MNKTVTIIIICLLIVSGLAVGGLVVYKQNADREQESLTDAAADTASSAAEETGTAWSFPEYGTSEAAETETQSAFIPPVTEETRTTTASSSATVSPSTTTASPSATAAAPEQTTKQAAGWKAAYREFCQRKGYADKFISGSDGAGFGLRDMDKDGVPELLVSDPWETGTNGHGYIYTYTGGSVVLAGTSDSYGGNWWPHAVTDSRYPGIFTYIWYRDEFDKPNGMPFHLIYYYLENHEVKSVDVAADYTVGGQYEQITDDTDLYNAVVRSEGKDNFELITDTELNAMGWDAFCAKYGY